MPLISLSQVTIKEKVEIKPKAPTKIQNSGKSQLQSDGSSGDYFDPPLFYSGGVVTLGAALVATGEIDIQGAIDGNQSAVVTVVLSAYQDRQIAWKGGQPIPWGGSMYEGQSPYYDTVGGPSYIPVIALYLFGGTVWYDGTRTITVSDDHVDYSFNGLLYRGGVLATPVVATATVTGNFLPNAHFDRWNLAARDMTVSELDSVPVSCTPLDGNGNPYAPGGIDPQSVAVTWNVDAKGDYVRLSSVTETFDDEGNSTITYVSGKQFTTQLGARFFWSTM
jgi:hypothetical protein